MTENHEDIYIRFGKFTLHTYFGWKCEMYDFFYFLISFNAVSLLMFEMMYTIKFFAIMRKLESTIVLSVHTVIDLKNFSQNICHKNVSKCTVQFLDRLHCTMYHGTYIDGN